jgi:hypothetical protein
VYACQSGHGETGVSRTLRSPGKGHDHESMTSVLGVEDVELDEVAVETEEEEEEARLDCELPVVIDWVDSDETEELVEELAAELVVVREEEELLD